MSATIHDEPGLQTRSTRFTAALGTTMGLFWEVPIMLSLVFVGKILERRGFWSGETWRLGRAAGLPAGER